MKIVLNWMVLALLAFGGCTASQSASRSSSSTGKTNAGPGATGAEERIGNRARMLFEDANKMADQQRKTNVFDYPALERKYRAAADADSGFAEPVYNLGVLAERQGKLQEAANYYRDALNRKPTLRQAAVNLAVLTQNSGNVEKATAAFEELAQKFPDDASSRAHLADIYRQRGDYDQSIELAREALFRDPKNLTAYKVMVRAYLAQKQLSLARLVALRALVLDDGDPELHYSLGLVALAEKDAVRARSEFKMAVLMRADYVPAHVELVRLALEYEDYAGAEESLRRILQSKGKSAEVLLNMGVAFKGMGQMDKALQAYDEAQKVNSNLPAVYLNRGIIVALKGDPDKAKDYYQQFISLSGGEVAVPADHRVFALLREADAVIEKREQDKRAIEEAKKMEEESRLAEQAAKEEERKQKEAEFQKQQGEAKKSNVAAPPKEKQTPPAEDPSKKRGGSKNKVKADEPDSLAEPEL